MVQDGDFKPQGGNRFRYFAKSKNAAALISYRDRPAHTYTTTIQDLKPAVRYIRKQSAEYKIDPEKTGATGFSAVGTP